MLGLSAAPEPGGVEPPGPTPEQHFSKSTNVTMPPICCTFLQHSFPLEQPAQHVLCTAKSYFEKGRRGFTQGLWAIDLTNNDKIKKTLDELNLFQRFLHRCHFVQMTV